MYAIIATSGRQFRVAQGDKVVMDRLGAEVGAEVVFDKVLLIGGDAPKFGNPTVSGAKVTAKVVSHELGDKVITGKYVHRRRQRRRVGFRHAHTTLEILAIQG